MENNIEVKHDSRLVVTQEGAARFLTKYLIKEDQAHEAVLLLLSGGSAFSVLDWIDLTGDTLPITIGMVDERASKDESINNFAQLTKLHFYNYAKERGAECIDTSGKENPEELAKVMEKAIKEWKASNENGKIITVQGIGEDGHTAGIFAMGDKFKELFESDGWVVGYDAEGKTEHTNRATVTNTFLRNEVDVSVFYVVGENKKDIFKRVMENEGSINELPARILHEMREVHIFTDIDISK